MDDKVSVIMPSYNTAKYIGKSIDSVLAQTYTNWELIIVDDCSTDDTDNVVASYLVDERIHYLKNEQNSGAAVSRNRALREATGRWIAFLDSDDLWLPKKLEKQIAFMEEKGYSFSFTDYQICLNGVWSHWIMTGPEVVSQKRMAEYCYFSTITVMYDRNIVGMVQIEPVRKNNDYALWLKVVRKVTCYRFPYCFSYYIKHEGSISSGSKIKLIKPLYEMWRIAEHKSVLAAAYCTARNVFFGVIKKMKYRRTDASYGEKVNL